MHILKLMTSMDEFWYFLKMLSTRLVFFGSFLWYRIGIIYVYTTLTENMPVIKQSTYYPIKEILQQIIIDLKLQDPGNTDQRWHHEPFGEK